MLWPSTHGSLPSIALSNAPDGPMDDVRMGMLATSTNAATGRLLHMWAMRVQDFIETQVSTSKDHIASALVPCSALQATRSLVVLAEYLALALYPTATSYNDVGILLSSLDDQSVASRHSGSSTFDVTTGHSLSRVYFEAGLEVDPRDARLLTNLGSYWRKERNYEEAIRFVRLSMT
jgi:protein O-GlcNAc transferase